MQDNKASQVFVIGAVAAGLLATVLTFFLIGGASGAQGNAKTVVVVASHDLRPNVAIDPERDLKVEEIPGKFGAFKDKTLDSRALPNYKGEKLNRRVLAGQPVFLADLAAGGDIEFHSPNSRALTINVVAGPVVPGDWVKIVTDKGVFLVGGQTFRILMIDGATQIFRATTVGEQTTANRGARAVTLEVTEAQATEILKEKNPSQDKNFLLLCPPPATESASQPGS